MVGRTPGRWILGWWRNVAIRAVSRLSASLTWIGSPFSRAPSPLRRREQLVPDGVVDGGDLSSSATAAHQPGRPLT